MSRAGSIASSRGFLRNRLLAVGESLASGQNSSIKNRMQVGVGKSERASG
jgi:hypothetical protein